MEYGRPIGPPQRGRGRPVGADAEATRRTILEAARDVIAERGYHAATFQQVALRAGVSRPTLHYYFGSREQVYEVLLTEVGERMAECINEARQAHGLRSQLTRFSEALHAWSLADNATMRFLVAARLEHHRGVHRADASARAFSAVHTFYDSIVAQAVVRGELAADVDAAAVADMLSAVFWGMAFHAGFVSTAEDVDGVARQLLNACDNGLLKFPVGASAEA